MTTTPTELSRHLTKVAQNALAGASVPGASLALLLDGQPLFVSAVGRSQPGEETPLNADARFYIYSITKTLMSTLLLQLAEQGRVDLDAPVQEYLSQLPLNTPVTLRQLLNHTAGIPDYGALPGYYAAVKAHPIRPWTADEFLAATLPQGCLFPPGQGWRYSNTGYLLLRRVIEEVLHAPLAAALKERIFAPLGLDHPRAAQTLEDAQALTSGWSAFFSPNGALQDVYSLYHPGWVAHGVVTATALELAQVIHAVFTGALLQPEGRAAMLQGVDVPVQHPLFQQPGYGLGVMLDPRSKYGLMAGQGGGGPGYSAGALHFPDVHGHTLTCVALANSDAGDMGLPIAFQAAMLAGEILED